VAGVCLPDPLPVSVILLPWAPEAPQRARNIICHTGKAGYDQDHCSRIFNHSGWQAHPSQTASSLQITSWSQRYTRGNMAKRHPQTMLAFYRQGLQYERVGKLSGRLFAIGNSFNSEGYFQMKDHQIYGPQQTIAQTSINVRDSIFTGWVFIAAAFFKAKTDKAN